MNQSNASLLWLLLLQMTQSGLAAPAPEVSDPNKIDLLETIFLASQVFLAILTTASAGWLIYECGKTSCNKRPEPIAKPDIEAPPTETATLSPAPQLRYS